MSTIAERVAAGAAFLDGRHPGWWQEIDLLTLDLRDGCGCILGQLHDAPLGPFHFRDALGAYGLESWQAADLGFDSHLLHDGDEYGQLTTEWRQLIAARLSNDKTSGGPS